ncbi:MAG: SOS response-associated peptidase [Rhodospirillaceae bacterium]|nr:SOS response-associated peptidase [Rhodospirillaceae bacterium]
MCGRYTLSITPEMLRTLINFSVTPNLEPRFNIAPTQMAPVVRGDGEGGRKIDLLRWGLIPSWSKDMSGASRLINARGETVAQKPSFRNAYQECRCLIPVDGFYEWRKEGDIKQPFRIGFQGGKPFVFAGLWETWTAPDGADNAGETIETYTIITTDANTKIAPIHHRMPVIVDPADFDRWLTGTPAEAANVIRAFPADDMAFYRVSTRVNNVRNDDAECIVPLAKTA